MKNRTLSLLLFVLLGLVAADQAKAVPPPDFIFNVGSSVAQIFSISVLFLGAITSSLYQFIRVRLVDKTRRRIFIGGSVFLILVLAGGGAWLYGRRAQQIAYHEWIAMSEQYRAEATKQELAGVGEGEAVSSSTSRGSDAISDGLDQLALNGQVVVSSTSPIVPPTEDAVSQFIRRYYQLIGSQQLDQAYQLSKQSVSLATFKSWYADTQSVTIDKLQRIDDKRSSLELTLEEKGVKTKYGVVLDVILGNGLPTRIGQSTVRILSSSSNTPRVDPMPGVNAPTLVPPPSTQGNYFNLNEHRTPLSITNEGFQAALDQHLSFYIVDAREDIEYENGHFPGANHLRFADLKAGRWIEVPQDKPVYVFCWSGIRGKEVTEFLRSKKILASYLDHGANGWVFFGGEWDGNINFAQKYNDPKYQLTFTTDQVKQKIRQGVVLIDSRSPGAYQKWHLPGSISLSLISTPTIALSNAYAQIPAHSQIISICDDYVNCFDAKLIGVELERRGHVFLGRYNRPWEMR